MQSCLYEEHEALDNAFTTEVNANMGKMKDLSDSERTIIVGTGIADANISETTTLLRFFSFHRILTVWRVVFTKEPSCKKSILVDRGDER